MLLDSPQRVKASSDLCGINLIISKRGKAAATAIHAMANATVHRGPDAMVFYTVHATEAQVYFGHNRLKIIDTSDEANQPFRSADGRFILAYNGEIYNYRELRQQLEQRSYTFRTQSDTEVILQLLIADGEQGIGRLNGMFAFAFYDTQEQHLWLARDRFGIKPLYYAETEDYLLISSEIKSILGTGLLKKQLNESQLYHYLRYKHAAKPQTFYKCILELEEGMLLRWRNGKSSIIPFMPAPPPLSFATAEAPEQLVQQVEAMLAESVQKHLAADVPVGLFLSGGIDSTLLLALLHQAGHRHFPAFSITMKTSEGSFGTEDSSYARLAARQYRAEHTCFEISDQLLAETNTFVASLDQPIADGAALLTSYLSKQVKPYIKVALSGAGADELFAGYNRHWAFYKYAQRRRQAVIVSNLLKPLSSLLPTGFNHPLRKQFVLLRKLTHKISSAPCQTFLNFTAMDNALPMLLRHQVPCIPVKHTNKDLQALLRCCLLHDQQHYLISDVLAITDQASMQHSLEIRTPYLYNGLQRYLQAIAPELLFKHGQKWILKEILAKHKGQQFLNRPKEGFGMPLGNWFLKPNNHWILEELQNPRHLLFYYLDFNSTQALVQQHLKCRQDNSVEIWALVILAKWLNHNFG